MGTQYGHLILEERCELARLQAAGRSIRQIATALDRAPSTVAREVKRNGAQTGDYKPVYADQQAQARRWRGSRLERDGPLRARVLAHLAQGWSPEQVKPAGGSSPTRASTASSIGRWRARRTMGGGTTCRGPSGSGAGGGVKGGVPLLSWRHAARLPSAPRRPQTAARPATGRPT